MKPYYEADGVTLYHGDCREILPGLTADAVVTDPPYGIGWAPRVNHRAKDHLWHDDQPFDPRPFLAVGRYHLFWGAPYFADKLPVSESWLTWVKRPLHCDFSGDGRSYATTETAWCDFGCKAAFIAHTWDGGMRAGDAQNRTFCHPSQKPIEVMKWCLARMPADAGVILDPFAGSGTTLRAALDMGRRAIGIEIEERYCEISARRLSQRVLDFGVSA
jgi:site-specific DNA-methyltransferase (adenine-specific)